jgi:hypothetical protein
MTILIKNQYSIFATQISWADFNDIELNFKNSSEPYLDQLFLIKKDASFPPLFKRLVKIWFEKFFKLCPPPCCTSTLPNGVNWWSLGPI